MYLKYLVSLLAILLPTLTFFASKSHAFAESSSDASISIMIVILSIPIALICFRIYVRRNELNFLKVHQKRISSTDPEVLLDVTQRCETYLKRNRKADEVRNLAAQARHKIKLIQISKEMETFKSEISEDGSHPAVVSILKNKMHNPDSFQHISSDYGIVEQDANHYQKVEMTFRATNTYNALVLQTCYFLINADKEISLVGSPDNSESSPVTTTTLAASAEAAVSIVEDATTIADLLSTFSSDEE